MRFVALVAAFGLLACHREPPPPATAPANAEDPIKEKDVPIGITTGSGSGGSGSGTSSVPSASPGANAAAPDFATDATINTAPIDPKVTGTGKTYMLVSESADASKVGKQILTNGGNAVDAAVATAFALAVVHPTAGNVAGGGFAVVRIAAGKAQALDFRETAPASATRDMYLDEQGNVTKDSLAGWRASGTPGSVAGLWALHDKLGKLPWRDLVQPAIDLARNGFALDAHTSESLATRAPMTNEATAAIWKPAGKLHVQGDVIKLEQLAVVLERIRDKGTDGFYKGPTAKAIADAMKANHGTITAADLANYKPVWRDPLRFSYRTRSIVSMPLPSSGGLVLAMVAGMLKDRPLASVPWHGAEHIHLVTEAWRRGYAARNGVLGDPAFVKNMPIETILSQTYLDKLAATITPNATKSADVQPLIDGDHTTNLCVVDAQGMAVALTTTLNTSWGSGVTISGFLMNNEMDDFAAKPGSPNVFGLVMGEANKIEPGKRMLSSMSPTFVEDEKGNLVMVVGAQGGPRIISAVWQVLSNVIDFNKTAAEAVALPRFHHQHLPDKLYIEAKSTTEATNGKLVTEGYQMEYPARTFGAANAIVRTPNGWSASADPREGGAAMGDD